jgi:hypothetical protein
VSLSAQADFLQSERVLHVQVRVKAGPLTSKHPTPLAAQLLLPVLVLTTEQPANTELLFLPKA